MTPESVFEEERDLSGPLKHLCLISSVKEMLI